MKGVIQSPKTGVPEPSNRRPSHLISPFPLILRASRVKKGVRNLFSPQAIPSFNATRPALGSLSFVVYEKGS